MHYILVRHKVADYAKWYPIYTENAAARKAGGSKGARLFRNSANPNEIVVLTEWDSLDEAKQFAQSADLRAAMEQAGVTGQLEMYFLEQIEQTSA